MFDVYESFISEDYSARDKSLYEAINTIKVLLPTKSVFSNLNLIAMLS